MTDVVGICVRIAVVQQSGGRLLVALVHVAGVVSHRCCCPRGVELTAVEVDQLSVYLLLTVRKSSVMEASTISS